MIPSLEMPPESPAAPRRRERFGVPLDNLGWFAILVVSFSAGLLAFCLTCFIAIFAVLFHNSASANQIDFAVTYKYFGLPAGLAVLALSLIYLSSLWIRRIISGRAADR